MAKVKIIVKDESGKEIPFFTKTLTEEFKDKAGKRYGIFIEEPNQPTVFIGEYIVAGAVTPDPHQCQEHEHWDEAEQKCVEDDIVIPPPTPGEGELIFDSDRDIDWDAVSAQIKSGEDFLRVDDTFGNVKANGKGFHMNASGNPRMYLYPAKKELVLEHDGPFGRAYFAVCNYEARLEADFMLETNDITISFKDRCRHQFRDMVNDQASDEETQGGQGTSFSTTKVDADLEIVHGGSPQEVSGPTKSLSPKLEARRWYNTKFSQFDKEKKDDKGKVIGKVIHVIDELDGKVVNEGDVPAPKQFFNKPQFMEWSEFWLRMNAPKRKNNRLHVKRLKLYSL